LALWITLLSSLFAISLGLALAFNSNMARPILGNFLRFYWVSAGIISVRWGASGERAGKLTIFMRVIGILVGLAVVSRKVTSTLFDEALVIAILGAIIVLTGLLHIILGFRPQERRHRRWTSGLLGVFEVILGLMLFLEPMERGPI
jgi:uncharacterized membrane protein HdeD (DUF308 family)